MVLRLAPASASIPSPAVTAEPEIQDPTEAPPVSTTPESVPGTTTPTPRTRPMRNSSGPRPADARTKHLQQTLLDRFEFEDSGSRPKSQFAKDITQRLRGAGHRISAKQVSAAVQDDDNNGRYGIDVLKLQGMLVDTSAQQIFGTLIESPNNKGLVAPSVLGTKGDTEVDKVQQQIAARHGLFVDANQNGTVEDSDHVYFLDDSGNRIQTTYGNLEGALKEELRSNQKRVDVLTEYAGRPEDNKIGWITGAAQANDKFWKVDKNDAWTLKPGVRPSDAVQDILTNSSEYKTECAQARTALLLGAHLEHLKSELGDDQGRAAFDKTFSEGGQYGLTISGHVLQTPTADRGFHNAIKGREPGSSGYFHTVGASQEGVLRGYVGENVVDLGLKDGKRLFFGHPGGIKTEAGWKQELAHQAEAKTPADLASAFANAPDTQSRLTSGILSGRGDFEGYLASLGFDADYLKQTGQPYAGPRTLDKLTVSQIQKLVAVADPALENQLTPYGAVYEDMQNPTVQPNVQPTSWLAAQLLKNGRAPTAMYSPDPLK